MKSLVAWALTLTCITSVGTASAQDTITIVDAVWSDGTSSITGKAQLEKACNGKAVCEAAVNDLGLNPPSGRLIVKILTVDFKCGSSSSYRVVTNEYCIFRLSCANPSAPQPTALNFFKLDTGHSPVAVQKQERQVLLPKGYAYCWDYTFDFNANQGLSSSRRFIDDVTGTEGIAVEWELSPLPFSGTAWLDRLYMVAGRYAADASARCPNHP